MKSSQPDKHALQSVISALKANSSSATFFVTGQYYLQNKEFVHHIKDSGFEVGYHGHTHRKLTSNDLLKRELNCSRSFIENINPAGFRAPWLYLPETLLGELKNWGFRYDSSTFSPAGNSFMKHGLEIYPVTSLRYFGRETHPIYSKRANLKMLATEIPIGSGIFLSLLRRIYNPIFNHFEKQNKPMVIYAHDWQLISPPHKKYSIARDGLRNTHRFPLLESMLYWIDNHRFSSLNLRLDNQHVDSTHPFTHYLTIDVEHLGNDS